MPLYPPATVDTGTTILDGVGPPDPTLGVVDNYYVDTSGNDLYGPRIDVSAADYVQPPYDTTSTGAYEIGGKFRFDVAGFVTGIRYYYPNVTPSLGEIISLWDYTGGTLLATKVATLPTRDAWNVLNFDTPVPVLANHSYIASIWINGLSFSYPSSYTGPIVSGHVRALANGEDGDAAYYNTSHIFPTIIWSSFPPLSPMFTLGAAWPMAIATGATAWTDITGKPSTFPPTLPIAESDVTNLTTDLAAKVSDTGDTMTGDLTITKTAPSVVLNKTAANEGGMELRTGGLLRWKMYSDNSAEGGSNAGSHFRVSRYNDAGTLIDNILAINRTTGGTSCAALTTTGAVVVPVGSASATTLNFGTPGTGIIGTSTTVSISISSAARVAFGAGSVATTVPIFVPAATAGATSIRLPHGVAPTSPTNGDMWTTTAGLFVQINGATIGPLT